MAGETLNPPKEVEETLVTDGDERFDASVTPVLPVELDTALDTFLSTLDLEDTTSMDFAISSSLSEALENGHDAEALISVVEQLEPQQVVELLASIDNPSDVPDTVTMNSLLSGDPNSQAAQFILENLAKQCASGAFITMQSTQRQDGREAEAERKRGGLSTSAYLQSLSGIDLYLHFDAELDAYREQFKPAFLAAADKFLDAETVEEKDEIFIRERDRVLAELNSDPKFAELTQDQRDQLAEMFVTEQLQEAIMERLMERDPSLSQDAAREMAQAEMLSYLNAISDNPESAPAIISELQSLTAERTTLESLLATKQAERDEAREELTDIQERNLADANALTDPVEKAVALSALDSMACPTPSALEEQIRATMAEHGETSPDEARVQELVQHYHNWATRDAQEIYKEIDISQLEKQIREIEGQISALDQRIADLEAAGLTDSVLADSLRDERQVYSEAQQQLSDDLSELSTQAAQAAQDAEEIAADLETAEMKVAAAEKDVAADENNTMVAAAAAEGAAASVQEMGFAVIGIKDLLDSTPVEHLPPTLAMFTNVDREEIREALGEASFLVDRSEDGQIFAYLGNGERFPLSEEAQQLIQTAGSITHGIVERGFRTDFESGGVAVQQMFTNTATLTENVASLTASEDRLASAKSEVESAVNAANEVRENLDGYRDRATNLEQRISDMKAAGLDTSAFEKQLQDTYDSIYQGNVALGTFQVDLAQQLGLPEPNFSFLDYDFGNTLDTSLSGGNATLTLDTTSSSFLSENYDLGLNTTPNLGAADFNSFDLNTLSFGNIDFTTLTGDLTTSSTLAIDSPYSVGYQALDLSYDFYDDSFFDFDFGSLDYSSLTLDDTYFQSTQELFSSIDTTSIEQNLSDIEAGLNSQLQELRAQILVDAGVPPELHEAFLKDLDVSMAAGVCVDLTHVKDQLGIAPFSAKDLSNVDLFNAASTMTEEEALAQRLQMTVDQLAFTEEGERFREIIAQLEETTGEKYEYEFAGTEKSGADEGAEALTLEGATSEAEMTESFRMHQDALAYIEQFGSNGYDDIHAYLEDKFDREIPQAEMDTLVAKIENDDGIEIAPSTLLESTAEEKPEEQELEVASVSPAVRNDFDHSAYTPA